MTINEIANLANDYTDENFSDSLVQGFADSAISRINVELNTALPFYGDGTYLAISDDWQRMIVVPFVCWSIKMNDSSLNEAERYRIQFESGMVLLRRNKNNAITEEYRDGGFSNRHEIKPWFNKKTKEPVDPFDPDTHRSVIEYWFEEE